MTRAEAIEILKAHHMWTGEPQEIIDVRKENKALEMAIQALEQNESAEEWYKLFVEKLDEQEPCDDAISREAVCNIVNDIRDCISVEGYWAILERLKKLPPVTQKSETVTEFADRCRECGARYGKLLTQKSGKWIDYRDDG